MGLARAVRFVSYVLLFAGTALRAHGDGFSFQQQAQLVSQTPTSMVIKGVRWGFRNDEFGKAIFRDTTIALDQVREVYYYSEPFNVDGIKTALNRWQAHGLLFFEMKDPGAVRSAEGLRDIGIGVSAEARRETPAYSAIKGLQHFYKLHYQISTEKDRLQWGLTIWKERIQRFRLKLDDRQKEQLFKSALEESCRDHSQEWYNAITNSCVGAACRLMNTVLPADGQLTIWTIPHVWYNMKLGIPSRTPGYLMRRGAAELEGEWAPGLEAVEFPTSSSGAYRIALKDLPELGGQPGGRSPSPPVPALPATGDAPEIPLPTAATLNDADRLGVRSVVDEDTAVLKQMKDALHDDVPLH